MGRLSRLKDAFHAELLACMAVGHSQGSKSLVDLL